METLKILQNPCAGFSHALHTLRGPADMKKAPRSADEGSRLDPLSRFGHMRKLKVFTGFGHILTSWTDAFLTSLGSVSHMASQGGPRVLKGHPQGAKRITEGLLKGVCSVPKTST